jgi:hypothetical protein
MPDFNIYFETCLHNIKVGWWRKSLGSYCVTHYAIDWVQIGNGKNQSSIVSVDEQYFVLEDLEGHEQYEVSVRALNEEGNSSDALTIKMKTQANGKYQTPNIFSLMVV